ncbi:MAG: LamG domain-containing protein [Fibrobacter sp.]|nr:LamG domain-containing protein [Fibrobacter sp.]
MALTVFAGTAIAAEVPSDGLVAYYACSGNFDNSAPTSLPQAINHSATFAADRFGNANSACYFDGNESYIEVPDDNAFSIITTGALTVSAWMSPEVLNFKKNEDGCYVHWMGKGEPKQHEWTFRMYNNYLDTCSATDDRNRHNRISAYAFNLGGNLGSGSYVQEAVTAGEWIHIVARYDTVSNTITIFKNGAQKDQDPLHDNTYNVVPENGTAPFRMGTRSKWTYFQGRIDDVRIYNRALYDEEILALYNEAAPSSSSSSAVQNSSSSSQAASSSSNLITSSSSLSPTSNSSESSSTSSDISSSSAEPAYSSSSANSSSPSGFSSSSAVQNSSSSEPQSSSSAEPNSSSSNATSSSSAEPNSSSESEIGSSSSGTEKILPLGKALLSPENKGSGAIYRANGQKAPEGVSARNRVKGTYYKKIRQ